MSGNLIPARPPGLSTAQVGLATAGSVKSPISPSSAATEKEPEICHICASPIAYLSLSPCLHSTCHVCALRLRALYKSTSCSVCKRPQPRLLFLLPSSAPSIDHSHNLSSQPPKTTSGDGDTPAPVPEEEVFERAARGCPYADEALAVRFETLAVKEAVLALLRFNCPMNSVLHKWTSPGEHIGGKCKYVGSRAGWTDLQGHVRIKHGREMCPMCIKTKKIFSHEQTLYTARALSLHLPSLPRPSHAARNEARGRGGRPGRGRHAPPHMRQPETKTPTADAADGGESDEDFEEPDDDSADDLPDWTHPQCAFDRTCFATDDELFAHLREAHEECFICRRAGERDVYFPAYESLEQHFSSAHYPCPHPACVTAHFVVFGSPLDLKAHYVEAHGAEMGRGERREMGRVEGGFVSGINNGTGSGGGLGGGDRGGRRGRFGAQLTDNNQDGGRWAGGDRGVAAASMGAGFSSIAAMELQRVPLGESEARALQALLAPLPPLPPTQHLSLRAALLAWLSHQAPARDLLGVLGGVLGAGAGASVGAEGQGVERVGRAISSLCRDGGLSEEREREMREAANAWRVEQRQTFPSLTASSDFAAVASGRGIPAPPPAPSQPAVPTFSSRAAATRGRGTAVWDRVERAAASAGANVRPALSAAAPPAPSAAFPVLGTRAPARNAAQGTTAWSASGGAASLPSSRPPPAQQSFRPTAAPPPSSSSSITSPQPRPAARARPPPPVSHALFPTLPTRDAPRVPTSAVGGSASLRAILGEGRSTNSWANGSPSGPPASASAPASGTATPASNGNGNEDADADAAPAFASASTPSGKKKKKVKETLFTLGTFPT